MKIKINGEECDENEIFGNLQINDLHEIVLEVPCKFAGEDN